jgi:outer membrane protein assembly factor BamB
LPVNQLWSMGARLGIQDADGFRVVDARTGASVWDRPIGTGRAIAADRTAAALVDGATLTLVDPGTGAPRWQSAPLVAGAENFNSVALAGDRIYVAVGCSLSD